MYIRSRFSYPNLKCIIAVPDDFVWQLLFSRTDTYTLDLDVVIP